MNESQLPNSIHITGGETHVGGDMIGGNKTVRDEIHAETVIVHNHSSNTETTVKLKPLAYIPTRSGTRYVDRGIEAQVRAQLVSSEGIAAVVSVFAPGGVGKSEMASVIAQQIGQLYEAVVRVDFGKKSVDQVLDDLARAVGCLYSPRASIDDKRVELTAFLTGRHLLLLFDDVRVENEALLNDFIPPPHNSTLITSRIVQLPHTIPTHARHRLDLMNETQAKQLLAAALGQATHDAEPDAVKKLIEICRGNPLALDIASKRIRDYGTLTQPIGRFVSQIEHRLEKLVAGHDARQNLYAVFDESYEPLSHDDRARFRRLSVFANSGFSVTSAATLWDIPEDTAEQTLREFQNLSLVTPTEGATLRYRLHDLLDDYAMHRLREAKEENEWRDRHARQMVELFEKHYEDDLSDAPELGNELTNLRQAASWATEMRNGELLARLATAPRNWLYNVFWIYDEWHLWLQTAIELGIQDKALRARTCKALGDVNYFTKDTTTALASYQHALLLFQEVGSTRDEAQTHFSIGQVQRIRHEFNDALESFQHALLLCQDNDLRHGEGNALRAIGEIYYLCEEFDAAMINYRKALLLFQDIGDHRGEGFSLLAIGDVQRSRGEYAAASASYDDALHLFQDVGSKLGEGNTFRAMALLELAEGNGVARAQEFAFKAALLHWAIADRYNIASDNWSLADALAKNGEIGLAKNYAIQAVGVFEEIGLPGAERMREILDMP